MRVLLGAMISLSTFTVLCWWSKFRNSLPPIFSIAGSVARAMGGEKIFVETHDRDLIDELIRLFSCNHAICTGWSFRIEVPLANVKKVMQSDKGRKRINSLWFAWPASIIIPTPFDKKGEDCRLVADTVQATSATRHYIEMVISNHWWGFVCDFLSRLIPQGVGDDILPPSAELVRQHLCEGKSWRDLLIQYRNEPIEWMGRVGCFYFGRLSTFPCMVGIQTLFTQGDGYKHKVGKLSLFLHAERIWREMKAGRLSPSTVLLESYREAMGGPWRYEAKERGNEV